ncbi:U-box domain-containing protein 3-like [Cicer arietinum]|uniref:RING-type E3 ubiquitin transferase n=1 Tax=Cicer arietinum TaxID=3827 RepID=A0A1S2XVF7_CICAR|nr:U-box domain-containing protein 3-like [Cicer arietinum]XP_027189605.1 U-box domain-containing protein 3-like [Cicer arietinum]
MHIGQTDTASVKCLINSISRFILLVSCQTVKPMPFQKICNNMVEVLKRLKPVLDDVMDYNISSHENLCKVCEELDIRVNEARDFIENWGPKKSKIHSVLQSGTLLIKLQSTSLDICHMIVKSLQSPPSASVLANLQHYIQELQCLKKETAMVYIEKALRNQRDNIEPSYEHLKEIIELLKLASNQELLKESIAVEKERLNMEGHKMIGELEEINEIVNLVRNICDYVVKTECFSVKSGVSLPPYFRCPLSLELMLDPVIVASGQTYERQSIQKWLDHGLTVCPKTRQRLTHTNLIPNYTVKAMISTWCEENNTDHSGNSEHSNSADITTPSDHLLSQELARACGFGSAPSGSSISRPSLQTGNAFEKQKGDNSFRSNGECNGWQNAAIEKWELQSPYNHSRSESFSSSISSSDCLLVAVSNNVLKISNKHQNAKVLSGEITNVCPASPWLSGKQFHTPGPDAMQNGKNGKSETSISHSSVDSRLVSNLGLDELTASSHVNKLIEDLRSQSIEVQTTAAEELRLLTKHNTENRIIVGQCGAVKPLLSLLYSDGNLTQEHAVTALLNLSINEDNKALIMEAGAIDPLIHVLKTGNDGAKENSAAALFSLSVLENSKAKIGRSGAVKALVDLLASGTLRGKKDAATALYNLSIFHENKARIVQAGAVKFLVQMMDPDDGMVDKAIALLSNLSTIAEGRLEIAREGGIPLLVEIVESGSQRGKENAASILLQLCLHSSRFCTLVLQEGAVPPLVALSQSGTLRAKEKAQQLLSHFRNQREGATGKGKS